MYFTRKTTHARFLGLVDTVPAASPAGVLVTTVSFGALTGGVWTIAANSQFAINSGTGAVTTTSTPTVAGTTYTPIVTFSYENGGLVISANQALSITAMLPGNAPRNSLLSPIDFRALTSPVDARILLKDNQ
jgi:hypothetical protein